MSALKIISLVFSRRKTLTKTIIPFTGVENFRQQHTGNSTSSVYTEDSSSFSQLIAATEYNKLIFTIFKETGGPDKEDVA
jgi:hypothetical protein